MQRRFNELKLGVILSYFSRIITVVVGLIYTPIMIRLLGQAEFGIYNIAASIIAYLGVLNFGFGSAYIRFYSRYKLKKDSDKIASLNGMFLVIFGVLGLIAIISGVVLALNVDVIFGPSLTSDELRTAQTLLLILIVNLGISFPALVFNTYIQANEKFIVLNSLQIVRQVTTPLVNLPLLLAGYGSIGMVIGTTLINILIEIFTVLYSIKKMNMEISLSEFDPKLMREMIIFSSFIFMNMVVDEINNNVDKTLLGRYQGSVSVAIYSVAVTLKNYYQQISTTISAVFIPRIHRLVATGIDDGELTNLFTRVGRIQFILLSLILTGFGFFGRPFISIWAGNDYSESYLIGLFLMVPLIIPLTQTLGIEIQRAKNMHQFRSYMYMGIAVGNLLLSIPLAIRYGAIGTSFATGVATLIGHGFAMNWYNHNKIGLDMKYFWSEIAKFIPALIAPVLYGVLINYFVNLYSIMNLLIYGMIYVLIFLLAMWNIGMNDYEKSLIKNPFK